MRVCLLDIKTPEKANLDCMGGFGVGSAFGRSWFTKLVARGKRDGVNLPLMTYGLLAGAYRQRGDDVVVGGPENKADLYYMHHSLVGYNYEYDSIKKIKIEWGGAGFRSVGPLGRERVSAINSPWPDWSVFDYKNFSYYPSLKVKPVIPVLSSEGCKFKCSYCPYRSHYGDWVPRPVQDVADECRRNKDEYGARGIVFRDPLFTGDVVRTRELCEAIETLHLQWACETRLECLDRETVCAMARAGCRSIHIGVEAASKLALAGVGRKNLPVQVMRDLICYAQKQGVKVLAFFILGLPEDTYGGCEATIKLAVHLNPDLAEFFICTPYPGTPLYDQLKDRLLTRDYARYNGFTPVFQHDYITPEELLDLRELAYRTFYLRPGFVLNYLKRR